MRQEKIAGFPAVRTEEPLSERQLQDAVIELGRILGYRVAHFRPARVRRGGREIYETPVAADGKGWPDLVLVHAERQRVVFAELKVGTNKPTEHQQTWLRCLNRAGADVHLWTDRDWHRGDIEAELRRAA